MRTQYPSTQKYRDENFRETIETETRDKLMERRSALGKMFVCYEKNGATKLAEEIKKKLELINNEIKKREQESFLKVVLG